jgi:hypothetical protein
MKRLSKITVTASPSIANKVVFYPGSTNYSTKEWWIILLDIDLTGLSMKWPIEHIHGPGNYVPYGVGIPHVEQQGAGNRAGCPRTLPTRIFGHQYASAQDPCIRSWRAGLCRPIDQSVFLPDFADYNECEEHGIWGWIHPEAMYMLYPFDIPQAIARLDLGGQAAVVGDEQLPGVCRDYFTAQHWVDLSNSELGITVALPENPVVQFGNFHFGDNQSEFRLDRSMLLGWITNNYWEVNFRAHQPGRVRARYRILPHRGSFNEAQAHRCGIEAAYAQPLFQQMGEPTSGKELLPGTGSLLRLPESISSDSPVLTLHVKPAMRRPGLIAP